MKVKTILLVDDDSEDREFFISMIGQIDPTINVTIACSKIELFSLLRTVKPDLLFMDSYLDYESGILGITEIRVLPDLAELPIIMYTGSSDSKNIQNAFLAGASLYIVKPQSLQEMKTVLQQVLSIEWKERKSATKEYYIDGVLKNCE